MSGSRHRWLIGLFPRCWRQRYGEEFLALLEAEGLTPAGLADIVKTAVVEWATRPFVERKHAMPAGPNSLFALSAKPSAALPVIMSLAALALVVAYIVTTGGRHQADEGATAHIFQLLVVTQLPVIGFFVLRWVRSRPLACLGILAVQAAALASALLPVWYFRL